MWLGCILLVMIIVGALPYPDEGQHVTTARIESCFGCQLTKYPEVKRFIEKDIHDFDGVTFKEVPGSLPEIVFFNRHDQELERHPLKCKSREDCTNILLQKGFKRNSKVTEEIHRHNDI